MHDFTPLAEITTAADENLTRFGLVGYSPVASPTAAATSVAFELRHEQGSLLRALKMLDKLGKNLIRIELQPTGAAMHDYIFFVDFEGRLSADERARLAAAVTDLRVLGEY